MYKRLGNYRLLKLIGQGGNARVYLGFHDLLEVPVAVKLLHRGVLSQAEYAHFLAEARMIARLEHAFIIRVRDFAVVDGVSFLVMDYAAGGSFRRHCPPGSRLPLAQILPIVRHMAEALDYAHGHGIVHRDVKPENLLVRRREVVLSDFGLATLQRVEASPGQAMGTPRYIAPEQTLGQVHPASDQYALAVCIYEWLAGQPPFTGTSAELIEHHRFTHPPSLSELVPNLPSAVEDVVLRALAKHPSSRFASVQAFATALSAAAEAGHQAVAEVVRPVLPEKSGQPSHSAVAEAPTLTMDTATKRWHLPVERNSLFTGREAILARLHSLLTASETEMVALSGLGGIGKTQTAVEYAYRYAPTWDGLFFLRAETHEVFLADFLALARLLHVSESGEAVTAWFNTHSNWLLILDNLEDLAVLGDLLPTQGHFLLTTRTQIGQVSTLDLGEMIEEEAMPFLLRRAGVMKLEVEEQGIEPAVWEQAKEIARLLDGLPLALDQAGAYIEETGCHFDVYLALYRTRGRLLLLQRRGQSGNYPDSVATTWSLSFERVRLANPVAAGLLSFCAFLVPDAIPEDLLLAASQEAFADPLILGGALYELGRYSLVRRDASIQSLSLHRLVQIVVRETISLEERRDWVQRVVGALLNAFPREEEETFWERSQRFLPHVEAILAQIEEERIVLVEAGHLFNRAGLYALKQAFYAQAERLLRAALDQRIVLLGGDHPDVAEGLNDLGMVYYLQADLAQAEGYFRRALAIKQRTEGNTEHVAVALNNVASLCRKQKHFAEAEQLFREALAIWQSLHVLSSQANVARTLNNLALLYQDQERSEEADAVLHQALRIWMDLFAHRTPDPDMAKTLNNLARLCRDQERFSEAEDLFLRAQEVQSRVLLPDHPDVAQTLSELAFLYASTGRGEEAESLYVFALEIFEQALGPGHQRASQTLAGYQALLTSQGRALPPRFATWSQ